MIEAPAIEQAVLLRHGSQARVNIVRVEQPDGLTRVTTLVDWYWLALRLPGERETRILGRRRTTEALLELLDRGTYQQSALGLAEKMSA